MTQARVKAVLLDIDGTLVNSNTQHATAWAEALKEFDYDVPIEQVRRWIGMGGDKILPRVDSNLDDEHGPGNAIAKRRGEIFRDRYVSHLLQTPGAAELLEWFRSCGLLRVAATSSKKDEFSKITRAADIAEGIDLAITSDDVERSKPDADIVQVALAKAACSAGEAIYLGDTPYDIEAARRAGVPVIALECGGSSREELRDADAVYETPAALLADLQESTTRERAATQNPLVAHLQRSCHPE
ncbi:MAG TPA: HAD family hydrolase [Candidatus Cybelea sp.]